MTRRGGFTVLELLVVMALISLLAYLLLPALLRVQAGAQQARCASQLRQMFLANVAYAADHGSYVAASSDFYSTNNVRWHGARTTPAEAFCAASGPLAAYLGTDKTIRACPAMTDFAPDGFEASCGGYGYNARGVGSRGYLEGALAGCTRGMPPAAIASPQRTVMFCDTAYVQTKAGSTRLIEYSFAEAYRHLADLRPTRETGVANPSIHFRHRGRANVVWCDGHVSAEPMSCSRKGGFSNNHLGWFGPPDNSLFDPY